MISYLWDTTHSRTFSDNLSRLAWQRSSVRLLMLTLMASIQTLSGVGEEVFGQSNPEIASEIDFTNIVSFIKYDYRLLSERFGDSFRYLWVQQVGVVEHNDISMFYLRWR